MESLTSTFHRRRRRRRKKVKTASTVCLQIFLFPSGTKTFHSLLSALGGEMLCFGVVITKKSDSELSYAGFLVLK